ncbi:class I SAM-dependent methyltransferase [Paenibacillus sp. 481]|uniref:class I SAM-dependent methyltransferase n=1 Tax=Paenibacillus sp. 481 TaxID=2835869 RepID=UPI001E4C9431|nr:class I SAM-dependent methyltransferase [Paenibacillus sp. 481]UHA72374.1 hypothetical protein KIK04_17050 [Paenibacillus sp. 481]
MKVDLGCGSQKNTGCTGIDIRNLPEVDIVCDINQGIPLPDNSVETLYAVDVLSYVDDLIGTMKEMYRICTHKAIVCIIAPYAHTYHHIVNPYYKHWFNEYTPLFFTNCPNPRLPFDESSPYRASLPNLSMNETLDIDFRLLKTEFFYSPVFNESMYDLDEREVIRQIQPNVVNEIMYHLLVIKGEVTEEEIEQLALESLEVPMQALEKRGMESSEEKGNIEKKNAHMEINNKSTKKAKSSKSIKTNKRVKVARSLRKKNGKSIVHPVKKLKVNKIAIKNRLQKNKNVSKDKSAIQLGSNQQGKGNGKSNNRDKKQQLPKQNEQTS